MIAIDKAPDNSQYRAQAINILRSLHRDNEALTQADAYVKLATDSAIAHSIRGQLLAPMKRGDEARAELEKSIAIEPNSPAYVALLHADLVPDAKTRLADALWVVGHDPWMVVPNNALKSLVTDPQAYPAMSAAYEKAMADHPIQKPTIAMLYGEMMEDFGHVSDKVALMDKMIAAFPKDAMLRNGYCWTRATHKVELDKAAADCDSAISLDPAAAYYDSRGMVHLQRGEWAAALNDYDASLAKREQYPESRYGRAIAEQRLGKADAAQADLAAARKANPKVDAEFAEYGVKP